MKRFLRPVCIVFIMMFSVLGQAASVLSEERSGCMLCGMYLIDYTHVKYTILDTEGKEYVTCGVQCGLLLALNLKKKFKSATMTDLFSHKTIPSEKGWYVFKSSIVTDMSPGLIGFIQKSHAEKFIKGFGGEVITYQQGLEKAAIGYK
jgi:nitrous oxide reductase accessory protein NosL